MAQAAKKNPLTDMSSPNFKAKSRNAFCQLVGLGVIFSAILGLISFKLYPTLILLSRSFNNSFEVVCGCSTNLSFTDNPILTSGLLLAGFLIAGLGAYVLVKISQIVYQTKAFVRFFLSRQKRQMSVKLVTVVSALGLSGRVVEVNSGQAVIFCFGFVKPKICVDSLLVSRLQKRELSAALRHEKHHLKSHEPIKLLLVSIIRKVLFFIPGIKFFGDKYVQFSEIAADQYATDNFTNRAPLARALYKLLSINEGLTIRHGLALSFFSLVIDQRIDQLSGTDTGNNPKTTRRFLLLTGLGLGLLASLLTVFNTPARAGEGGGICRNNQSLAPTQCELIELPSCSISNEIESSLCREY